MVKDRSFYKTFFSMSAVLILQNILTFSVNLADNIMLGGYKDISLSGAAAANQVQFLYYNILIAVGEGVVVLGSQYFGKKQIGPIKTVCAHAMRIGISIGAVLFVLVSLFPHGIVSLFTESEPIIGEGMAYLRLIRWSYLFIAATQVLLGALRSVGVVKIAPWLSASTLVINCAINYPLIYGRFGAPQLGVRGAAIGTIVARAAELAILLIYIAVKEKTLNLRPRDILLRDRLLLRDYLRVASPMMLVSGLWGLNTAVQNAIMGHISDAAYTAGNVANPLYTLVKAGAIGEASAASFIIGRTVGEGDEKKLKSYARTLQILFACGGVLSGLVLYFARIPFLTFFELSGETRDLADRFLKILAFAIAGMAYQMPTNAGIIRGGGNTRFPLILDIVSIWVIVLPLSALLAFRWGAPAAAVVFCLNADQIFKGVPIFIKVNFGSWARKLTR